MVDFIADEILAKLENYSKIHNGSMLLFPPTEKQDIFPSHLNATFKSLTPISQKKKNVSKEEKKYVPKRSFQKVLQSLVSKINFPRRWKVPKDSQ